MVRAMAPVRFDMTAGPMLVTVAVRASDPVACAPAHIGCTGLSWSENALFTIGERRSLPLSRGHCSTTLPTTITGRQGLREIVMLQGMARMDVTRRLNAHRALSLTVSFLALVGWGAFAYSAGSSASAEQQLRDELEHF